MTQKIAQDIWDRGAAAAMSEADLLLYRSNLLGRDLTITNYGGGNTSAKIELEDPLTLTKTSVLYVKGSGGDLGSMGMGGFSTLYQEKLLALEKLYRGLEHEDEMVGYLPHCTFNLNPRAASIDTPLHAYLPFKHVDHMHPDALIAIAASKHSQRLTAEIFEGHLGWLPWQRPGFDLALKLRSLVQKQPSLSGIVLGGHGVFTWGETSEECYKNTLRVIQRAAAWLERTEKAPAFGGAKTTSLSSDRREEIATALLLSVRKEIAQTERKIGHYNDSAEVQEFVNSHRLLELAALGTSCPDHFLRTKIRPLVLDFDPAKDNLGQALASLPAQIAQYQKDYAAYYDRCHRPTSPKLRDPNPVVYLVPGVGMLTFAKDKATARIAGEFYVNAINVMRGASSVDEYVGLDEQEAFNIEYWELEEAKLRRMPPQKPLAGRVAYITGGAGGIGQATARRLLQDGACVMLTDIDANALADVHAHLAKDFGTDVVSSVVADVTQEKQVQASFQRTLLQFGGVDLVVSNAGLASSATIEETTLELWEKNMAVLATGYFLVSREAAKIQRAQNQGGSIVFIVSKNALAASPGAAAYCAAKAAELHLARCLAAELADAKIRVNVVNPDAVLRGSRIWQGQWREERAKTYNIGAEDLEEHYRKRSLLKQSVFPEDIAEAVYFFASDLSRNSTGNILNVDAGNATAFTR